VWLVFTVWVALRHWRFQKRRPLLFLVTLAAPYFVLLMRYIPNAGYYCLLIPVLVLLPACFIPPVPSGGLRVFTRLAVAFVAVAVCQWLLIRPVPTTSLATGSANAYAFHYSRSGVKQGRFETLASIMVKNNVETNLVPPNRVADVKAGEY
jgi:hypothetical protein